MSYSSKVWQIPLLKEIEINTCKTNKQFEIQKAIYKKNTYPQREKEIHTHTVKYYFTMLVLRKEIHVEVHKSSYKCTNNLKKKKKKKCFLSK